MLQPSKGKKKKANGSSSYGQISSSQELRAESTNTIAKNFLSKAGKVAADMVSSAGGVGVGKKVLGAVKNMALSGMSQGGVKELPKSVSIRSKESTPSKSGTKIKPKYKKVTNAEVVLGFAPTKPLSPVNGNAFTGAMAKTGGDYDKAKEMLDGMPMMGKPKEGISMRIKSRLGLGK